MRQSLIIQLLEHLVICASSIMLEGLFVPYGQSLGRTIEKTLRVVEQCPHDFSLRSKASISGTLSRMKRRGIIERKGSKKKTIWRITREGKKHFLSGVNFKLPPEDGRSRLVMFDIPERERNKRDWLRSRLLACEYSPLQRSVWVGKRPLPQELFKELKERKLISCVHVVGLDNTCAITA